MLLFPLRLVVSLFPRQFAVCQCAMEYVDEGPAFVRAARDVDGFVVDEAWAAETDPGKSDKGEQGMQLSWSSIDVALFRFGLCPAGTA